MKPPMTVNLSLSLAYWVATLAAETGSGAIGDGDGTLEEGVARLADRAVQSLLGQGVLHHLAAGRLPCGGGHADRSFPQRSDPGSGSRPRRRRRRKRLSALRSAPAFERGPLRSPYSGSGARADAHAGKQPVLLREAAASRPAALRRDDQAVIFPSPYGRGRALPRVPAAGGPDGSTVLGQDRKVRRPPVLASPLRDRRSGGVYTKAARNSTGAMTTPLAARRPGLSCWRSPRPPDEAAVRPEARDDRRRPLQPRAGLRGRLPDRLRGQPLPSLRPQ